MKQIVLHTAGAIALSFALAACVPKPAPVPQPTPTPSPTPIATRTPPPATPVFNGEWIDAPQTPGDWSYTSYGEDRGKRALFSDPAGEYLFSLACVTQPNGPEILIVRTGQPQKRDLAMTIRTETAQRTLTARQGTPSIIATSVPASDPLLDAMALSRGRFAVEAEGEPALYLPSWPEVTRVIEDCR